MITTNPNRVSKSITNTDKSMPSGYFHYYYLQPIVYNELFKLHREDAILLGVNCNTQNVINGE